MVDRANSPAYAALPRNRIDRFRGRSRPIVLKLLELGGLRHLAALVVAVHLAADEPIIATPPSRRH